MILKITRKCSMQCKHCFENATPDGQHMPMQIFEDSIRFIKQIDPFLILVSGGEPLEHPYFFEIMEKLIKSFDKERLLIASNGLFLYNETLRKKVFDLDVLVQVTNDIRYYPKAIPNFVHKKLFIETHIQSLYPQGRAADNHLPTINSNAPKCFNIRSVSRNTNVKSFSKALDLLASYGKFCVPSIGIDGAVHLGESSLCNSIGTIYDTDAILLHNTQNFKCNRCKMENQLSPKHLKMLY